MRVYGQAITENWAKQGKETDRTTLDNLNDNNAMIDDDASSFDTMNGWNIRSKICWTTDRMEKTIWMADNNN
jgi:hypothetical protein